MAGPIWIDDVDLSTLGFQVVRSTGLDDAIPLEPTVVEVPALGHDIEASIYGVQRPRTVTLRLRFRTSDSAALLAAMHGLRARTVNRIVRLRHAQRPGQELVARCKSSPVETGRVRWVAPFSWEPTLEFVALDPMYRDTSDQVSGFGVATALPMGTADALPVVLFTAAGAAVTNPEYRVRDSSGVQVGRVAFTAVVANGDALEVDAAAGTIRKRVSGVWSNARDLVPIGQVIPILRASDGDWLTSSWPTIESGATAGAVNLAGSISYRRRWL